ncbi:MAG: ATPase domain-containing protein [Nanoarchaeota archaeon]|nr:ATPase domain-containing protein [Nanoarchaeota archaeon]
MAKQEFIGSYIQSFDEALGGGFPRDHIVLVYGAAGTMKSTLCFNVLYNEVLAGKKGVYISIEQSSLSLLKQMVKMGFDISKVNIEVLNDADDVIKGLTRLQDDEAKKLTIIDFGTIRKQLQGKKAAKNKFGLSGDMVESILSMVQTLAKKKLCDIVVLDSMTALYSLTELKEPRSEIFYLFEFFRDLGITSFVISEENHDTHSSRFGIESYLVDGIVHIMLTERNRKVTRELQIRKMRATDCNNDIFTLEFDSKTKKFKALYGGKMPLV